MSKIFRSEQTIVHTKEKKEISIRPLSSPQLSEEDAELTLAEVIYQKDRMLREAKLAAEVERKEIEKLRETAVQDIEAMQQAWEQEKVTLQQQAYDEAFQIGYEEGRKKALSEMAASIEQANQVIYQAKENAEKYLESQERVILEIAIKSAERIISKELSDDESTYIAIVKRGLKEAREMKDVKLYVSPDYYELVSKSHSELAALFPPDIPFYIFANDDFESTDCTIETNHGRIVVSVDEQLNELKERLVEILESGD